MFYGKELVINGTKYIRADRAVDYVRDLEEQVDESILKSPIADEYKMTQEEYFSIADLFERETTDKQFIEIENATIHVLDKEQFKMLNRILNCYYDLAYARMDNALTEVEDR